LGNAIQQCYGAQFSLVVLGLILKIKPVQVGHRQQDGRVGRNLAGGALDRLQSIRPFLFMKENFDVTLVAL